MAVLEAGSSWSRTSDWSLAAYIPSESRISRPAEERLWAEGNRNSQRSTTLPGPASDLARYQSAHMQVSDSGLDDHSPWNGWGLLEIQH